MPCATGSAWRGLLFLGGKLGLGKGGCDGGGGSQLMSAQIEASFVQTHRTGCLVPLEPLESLSGKQHF